MLYRLSLILCVAACTAQPTDYTSEQVREDLEYLHTQLQTYHPGLYRYTSKDSIDHYFAEAREAKSGLNGYELYERVTFLLSKVRCGHTRSQMPENLRIQFDSSELVLPFTIKIFGDKVYVNRTLDDAVSPGMELLSINGKSLPEIKSIIYSHQSSDGFNITGKERLTEFAFEIYYQLYVDRGSKNYELEVKSNEGVSRITVEGVSVGSVDPIRNRYPNDPLLLLEHREQYSYMRIRTFGSSSLSRTGENYDRFLRDSFRELKKLGVKNLVLDLRGNGGGRDNYGALLVSYLARESFGYFDNIQVTENYRGSATEKNGKFYMTRHDGLSIWDPQPDSFEGNIYVLTDGFSFSTCADVATVLHHKGWATFIGQETGGGYDGNTSGDTRTITLPNSNATVNLPMWMYTTANVGHKYHGRGVIPDYEIVPSWAAFAEGRDEVLEKAEFLIESR